MAGTACALFLHQPVESAPQRTESASQAAESRRRTGELTGEAERTGAAGQPAAAEATTEAQRGGGRQWEPVALPSVVRAFVGRYCIDCHSGPDAEASLDLEALCARDFEDVLRPWERVARKLFYRQMPPPGWERPDSSMYVRALDALHAALDAAWAGRIDPGRTATFRRLTRTEYAYAVRDLFGLEVDVSDLLPEDAVSGGFDNITVGNLSPTHLEKYVASAERIARQVVGRPPEEPEVVTLRLPADLTQERHVDGLPPGTRGGLVFQRTFPASGEYEIRVRLSRDRNEHVEGLTEPHRLLVLLDRRPVGEFTVRPPKNRWDHTRVDRHLRLKVPIDIGRHRLGVTFAEVGRSLEETLRQPYQSHFNMHRHPRTKPAVFEVSIVGPFDPRPEPISVRDAALASRRWLFVCRPRTEAEERPAARRILGRVLRLAYRRPVVEEDFTGPLRLFELGRAESDFELGIETAIAGILANPNFLLRIERDPPQVRPGAAYTVDPFALASRLSFFLWSSLPDETLLELAEQGRLSDPAVLRAQAARMLRDARAEALVSNFAAQWLHVRNLAPFRPDARRFPDFDENLRRAFREETLSAVRRVIRENRPVIELLQSDRTYLNERLAKHYGIHTVHGSRFREVALQPQMHRGGLLRHGSILTVTSYATRTSPVLRGKWILENILGTPPPPPPEKVPALPENTVDRSLPLRQRLAAHRADARCAVCHDIIDPVGFALEHYDAVGRWREREGEHAIDAGGGLPDGTSCVGVEGLERALVARGEWFARALAEKLLTFALGRGLEPSDGPSVRRILRYAAASGYRFGSLIEAIVTSEPFRRRRAAAGDSEVPANEAVSAAGGRLEPTRR